MPWHRASAGRILRSCLYKGVWVLGTCLWGRGGSEYGPTERRLPGPSEIPLKRVCEFRSLRVQADGGTRSHAISYQPPQTPVTRDPSSFKPTIPHQVEETGLPTPPPNGGVFWWEGLFLSFSQRGIADVVSLHHLPKERTPCAAAPVQERREQPQARRMAFRGTNPPNLAFGRATVPPVCRYAQIQEHAESELNKACNASPLKGYPLRETLGSFPNPVLGLCNKAGDLHKRLAFPEWLKRGHSPTTPPPSPHTAHPPKPPLSPSPPLPPHPQTTPTFFPPPPSRSSAAARRPAAAG